MDRLDPAVVAVSDAMTMVDACTRIERMAATDKTVVAKRATDSPRLLKHKGYRDGLDYLARTLDITTGEAAAVLGIANVLDGLDATTDAAKQGGMAPREVIALTAAASTSRWSRG